MVEWHIQDFPKELIVKLKDGYLREVVDGIGGQRKTARLLKVSYPSVHAVVKGKKCLSLKRLFKIIELSPETEKFRSKLEQNILAIKAPSSRAYWVEMPLPLKLTPELARIIGHILGDGNIRKTRGVNVRYGDPDPVAVSSFIRDMKKVFGKTEVYLHKKPGKTVKFFIEVSYPSAIGRILRNFFGYCGTHDGKIPEVIMKANENIKKEVVIALFDDEGTISEEKYEIKIGIVNKRLYEQIKKLLEGFSIKSNFRSIIYKGSKIFSLSVTGRKNQRLFWSEIGLTKFTKKWRKFKNYFDNLKPYGYDIDQLIINVVKKNGKRYSDVLKTINIPESTFYTHLKNLQKQNIIHKVNGKWEINEQK